MWELGLILLVALILLGPRQLTETARVLGRLYREVTKMTNDLRSSIDLDSMTSTTSSSPHFETRPSQDEAAHTSQNNMDMLTPPGERSGPDFYAELLENSKEDDEEEATRESETREEQRENKDTDPARGKATRESQGE